MVVFPTATGDTRPLLPPALLTVTTLVLPEDQVTEVVMSELEPSEKMPVAIYCWVTPKAKLEFVAETLIDANDADVTVTVLVPVITPNVAVMTEVPVVNVVTRPRDPATLLIVATAVVPDDQVTSLLISLVEESE